MNTYIHYFFLLRIFCALMLVGGCGTSSQRKTKNTLVVGMLSADAPFMSVNERGDFEGFDVDVAHAIAQRLGKTLEIQPLGLPELFAGIQMRSLDMMMCGLSITNERRQKFAMVHYQGEGVKTYPLVFWERIPQGIRSLENFRGKGAIIYVLPGSTHEQFLTHFPYIMVKTMNSYAEIVLELQYGKGDAAIFDEAIGAYARKFTQLCILHQPLGDWQEFGHGIALNKDNQVLAQHVERVVAQLKNEGVIAQLEQKWRLV